MVLSNVGLAFSPAIASISERFSANALSNAGMKCLGLTRSNGGISNGVVHLASKGFWPPLAFTVLRGLAALAFRLAAVGLPLLLAIIRILWPRWIERPMSPLRGIVET